MENREDLFLSDLSEQYFERKLELSTEERNSYYFTLNLFQGKVLELSHSLSKLKSEKARIVGKKKLIVNQFELERNTVFGKKPTFYIIGILIIYLLTF